MIFQKVRNSRQPIVPRPRICHNRNNRALLEPVWSREEWGKGIATEALAVMVGELTVSRGIEIVTASTMIQNSASARVLMKNGFTLVNHAVGEDWGFPEPTPADKWIR